MKKVLKNKEKKLKLTTLGFTQAELETLQAERRFLDVYDQPVGEDMNDYSIAKLGDATIEMGPLVPLKDSYRYYQESWYADNALMFNTVNSWLSRGGALDYSSLAGIFAFSGYAGGVDYGYHSSRIVLV